jgi:hypothetical protein
MRFRVIFLLILWLGSMSLSAQKFEWEAGFDGFLDNREYFSIDNPQTIFGSRIRGEIGASLESGHRMMAGINYLYEFGSQPDEYMPDITMYYQYKSSHVDFKLGAFPRQNLLHFPQAMLSDTLQYYRPNIQGAYFAYKGDLGFQNVFIDWVSRQTDTRPEQFMFGFSGMLKRGVFFLENYLLMGHLAGAAIPEPDFHLRDNGGFQVKLGTDLSDKLPMDSLSIGLGTLVSLDRIRGVDDGWQTPVGLIGQFSLQHKWIGLDGLYYYGEGHVFVFGDPFYRLQQYGRLDIYYMPFRNDQVQLRIDVGMHFANGQLDFSQQILLSMLIGSR